MSIFERTMIYKKTLILTIVFLALISTSDLWSSNLGIFAMLSLLALGILFVVLFVMFGYHLFQAIRERFINRQRIYLIVIITFTLALSAYEPRGLINYNLLNGEPVLYASRKGAGSCSSNLYLYENGKFRYLYICFGTSSVTGEYKIIGDSIVFVHSGVDFYKYAIYNREEQYLQFKKSESDTTFFYNQWKVIRGTEKLRP